MCSVFVVLCTLVTRLVFVFKMSATQVMLTNAPSFLDGNEVNEFVLHMFAHYFVMQLVSVKS